MAQKRFIVHSGDAPICPLIEYLIIPTTVNAKIVVGRPYFRRNGEEIGIRQSIHVLDGGLEFY